MEPPSELCVTLGLLGFQFKKRCSSVPPDTVGFYDSRRKLIYTRGLRLLLLSLFDFYLFRKFEFFGKFSFVTGFGRKILF